MCNNGRRRQETTMLWTPLGDLSTLPRSLLSVGELRRRSNVMVSPLINVFRQHVDLRQTSQRQAFCVASKALKFVSVTYTPIYTYLVLSLMTETVVLCENFDTIVNSHSLPLPCRNSTLHSRAIITPCPFPLPRDSRGRNGNAEFPLLMHAYTVLELRGIAL